MVRGAEKVLAGMRDPEWFIPQMRIVDRHGHHTTLGEAGIFWSQERFIRSFKQNKRILVLKSRQLGITTIATACMVHKALFSEAGYNVLTVTHEGEAVGRTNQMIRHYLTSLPRALRPVLSRDNMRGIELATNGSIFRQLMAGGRSQGRSFTFQAVHATEMGFWPTGSAARKSMGVDEEVWSSIQATIHESPDTRVVVESTADGPSGIFHKLCLQAQQSESWDFLFMPWYDDPSYARHVPAKWERTEREQELVDLYGVDDTQLAWRRWKMEDQGYTLSRFMQEYPSNPTEPFMVSTGMWFGAENLKRLAATIPPSAFQGRAGRHIYIEAAPYHRYFIGLDPSGGTGGDSGVVQVIRDDMVQVAKFSSNRASPSKLAEEAAQLSALFGRAPILVEVNNRFGGACFERLLALGAPLWRHQGKPWMTTKPNKMKLLDYAREMIDGGHVVFHDPVTLQECMTLREQRNGDVRGDDGFKDDHVMALAFALWNARRSWQAPAVDSFHDAIAEQRKKRHAELGLR